MTDVAIGTATETVARLRGVVVRKGGNTLLREVDWEIRAGERWAVLGANGAGKTTLLQLLAGALQPSLGGVELLGESLDGADLDDLLPRVGWASAALGDRLAATARVIDVVLTGAYASLRRGTEDYDSRDLRRAQDLLARMGCRDFALRHYGSLSEGERKRVQLARALMSDPELILLDEPAAGLDLGGREALLRLLTRLASDPDSPAMVMVSHHVEEIPMGFTHALLLRDGGVVAAGSLAQVMTSGALTAAFGLPLDVTESGGRWNARAVFAS